MSLRQRIRSLLDRDGDRMKELLMRGWRPWATPEGIWWESPSGLTKHSLAGAWEQHKQGYHRHGVTISAEMKPGQWKQG